MARENTSFGRAARVAAAVLGLALLAACGGDGADADGAAAANGDLAGKRTDFRLARLDGGRLGPPDLADQVVLIDFWATWCVPCHAQADILKELYPEVQGDGVEFLAVAVGEDREIVEEFAASRPFPYPVLLDPGSEVADSLGVYSLPTLMVIDRRGRVAHFDEGIHDAAELRRILGAAGARTT